MRWVLLRQNGQLHRLIGHDFRDNADGSLYIGVLVTPGANPNGEFHVSYHCSGRVNFRGPVQATTYCEPTFGITRAQALFVMSLSSISRLQTVAVSGNEDQVLEVQSTIGPVGVAVAIAPDMGPPPPGIVVVTYPEWFRILVEPIPPSPLAEGSNGRVAVAHGLYSNQLIGRDEALIRFQQKRQGGKGIILNWESNTGVLRVVFATPMRVAPKATLKFERDDIVAEPTRITTAEACFRLKGRGGYLKAPVPIASLELDAEL